MTREVRMMLMAIAVYHLTADNQQRSHNQRPAIDEGFPFSSLQERTPLFDCSVGQVFSLRAASIQMFMAIQCRKPLPRRCQSLLLQCGVFARRWVILCFQEGNGGQLQYDNVIPRGPGNEWREDLLDRPSKS